MTTVTLTQRELEVIHKALCLLAERERAEAAADPQIDALFPNARADRDAITVLSTKIFAASNK